MVRAHAAPALFTKQRKRKPWLFGHRKMRQKRTESWETQPNMMELHEPCINIDQLRNAKFAILSFHLWQNDVPSTSFNGHILRCRYPSVSWLNSASPPFTRRFRVPNSQRFWGSQVISWHTIYTHDTHMLDIVHAHPWHHALSSRYANIAAVQL